MYSALGADGIFQVPIKEIKEKTYEETNKTGSIGSEDRHATGGLRESSSFFLMLLKNPIKPQDKNEGARTGWIDDPLFLNGRGDPGLFADFFLLFLCFKFFVFFVFLEETAFL